MPVTFDNLARAYPTEHDPCQNAEGLSNFDNQCAIRMGVCLADASVNLSSCQAARCWHEHGRRHILRAQELADWLASPAGRRAIDATVTHRSDVTAADYAGKRGIVFFKNFWGTGNQGDHIDLWNGAVLQTGALEYFARSQQVWFWELS